MSYFGAGADILYIFALIGVLQVIIGRIFDPWYKKMFAGAVSFLWGSYTFFLIIGIVYSLFVQHNLDARHISAGDLQAVFQTNIREGYEFLTTMFSSSQNGIVCFVFLIGTVLFFYCVYEKKQMTWGDNRPRLIPFGILCLANIVLTLVVGLSQSLGSPVLETIYSYRKNVSQMDYYRHMREKDVAFTAQKSGKGETYVLVIGESGNKRHCSAYGYLRDTTPWMNSLRHSNKVVFFENAYSSFVHTVPSLLNVLTAANQYNKESNFSSPSLIEIAKKAGFKTYWFSNQTRYSLIDNPLTAIAEEADETYFTANAGYDVDGKILNLIEAKLEGVRPDDNNLIIIHLMGSHEKYLERLPKDYYTDFSEKGIEYLGDVGLDTDFVQNELNPYDATIKYTDENLQKLYAIISKQVPDISAFFYMPDHGEDVYGRKRHMASLFTFEMARIPLMVRFSDKWTERNAERFETLKRNSVMPFTSDLFFEFFVGIAGIESSAIHDATLDIGKDSYSLTWDNAVTMWTNKDLQTQFYASGQMVHLCDDPEYIMRRNIAFLNRERPNTFLAIACDSVGSAYEAVANGFSGIEANITVQKDGIFMGHGPEIILPMTLDEYLAQIPLDKIHNLWLDTKLEDASLIPEWYRCMNELDNKYHLKSRTMLETTLSDNQVKIFPMNGWETNFYLLTRLVDVGMPCPPSINKLSENNSGEKREYHPLPEEYPQIDEYATRIAEVINRQDAVNISFWAETYPFIQQEVFPRLHRTIGYCSWAEPNFPLLDDPQFIEKYSRMSSDTIYDKKIKTYLVIPKHETYHVSIPLQSS